MTKFVALLLLHLLTAGMPSNAAAVVRPERCPEIRGKSSVVALGRLNITGIWVSPRCEMLKGPQFVLRKYDFTEDGIYKAYKFFYSDEGCIRPAYGLVTKGFVRPEGHSWFIDGATDMDFSVDYASLVAYSKEASKIIYNGLSVGCRRQVGGFISPLKMITVEKSYRYGSKNEADCVQDFDVSMTELQIVRQTNYAATEGKVERELQLGKTTDSGRSRPSSLQTPLWHSEASPSCLSCICVAASTILQPPRKCYRPLTVPKVTAIVDGDWRSQLCESHSAGLFSLKTLSFSDRTLRFRMRSRYFNDAFCSSEQFAVEVEGAYSILGDHELLRSSHICKFKYERVLATSYSLGMTESLNMDADEECGNSGFWRVGIEQDVTSTRGCSTLGVKVPDQAYVILKIEQWERDKQVMFISERKADRWNATDVITFTEYSLQQCSHFQRTSPSASHMTNGVYSTNDGGGRVAMVFVSCLSVVWWSC